VEAINQYIFRLNAQVTVQKRFVADAAHQLRTPLAVIDSQIQFARQLDDPQRVAQVLASLQEGSRSMTDLTNKLLLLSQAEASNGSAFPRGPVDLLGGGNGAGRTGRAGPEEEHRPRPGDHPGNCHGHRQRSPAGRHADESDRQCPALHPEGGKVTVGLENRRKQVIVTVTDNGPGIPAEVRERVFERFYRNARPDQPGSGLGLAIVREIVQASQGSIRLEVPASGTGLVVVVSLPAMAAPPTVVATPSAIQIWRTTKRSKVSARCTLLAWSGAPCPRTLAPACEACVHLFPDIAHAVTEVTIKNTRRQTVNRFYLGAACAVLGAALPLVASAQSCNVPVLKVLAQKSLGLTVMEKSLADYQKRTGTRVEISYFGENDRRAKSRLDASTKAGSYQVYYVDEANVAEFASAGWIVPLLKYFPKEADYDDFLPGRRAVASYKDVAYFAPLIGGSDFLFYRRDLLEKAGLPVPRTLDELVADIKKLHSPPGVYGWVARGQRGSGMNVWRWAPFMLAQGGSWTDKNNQPAFNSPAAVKATQLYAELFKYAPPGAATYDWSNALEAFRSGKVAFMIESTPFADWMEDSSKVQRGRQGRLCPSAGTAALGRLWPRPGHLRHRRQGRVHAPGGRQVHRLRHRQGTGTGTPARKGLQRLQPHQHHPERLLPEERQAADPGGPEGHHPGLQADHLAQPAVAGHRRQPGRGAGRSLHRHPEGYSRAPTGARRSHAPSAQRRSMEHAA
jgi:hypothetical protein